MGKQQSFADAEYAYRKRRTKRDVLPATMKKVVLWDGVRRSMRLAIRHANEEGPAWCRNDGLLIEWFALSDESIS